tara:strand:- start:990 stop:1424 length:435 start_codon:yes stop_codon:yes gene_type:complete
MATTATLTLTSADIAGDPVNVSKTATLTKAGGTNNMDQSTGLNRVHLRETTNVVLFGAVAGGDNLAAKVYIINKATDPTLYITVTLNAQIIGKLYAGQWLFMPWSQTDVAADIEIAATNWSSTTGDIPVEYCLFHEDSKILPNA